VFSLSIRPDFGLARKIPQGAGENLREVVETLLSAQFLPTR